jgi:hypothetical protein
MRQTLILLAGCVLFVVGCDASEAPKNAFKSVDAGLPVAKQDRAGDEPGMGMAGPAGAPAVPAEFVVLQNAAPAKGADGAGGDARKVPAGEAPAKRRIIYSASIDLIVTDFDDSGRKLQQLVDSHDGYIAKSDVGITSGERRHASWTLRVPVAKFRDAMDGLARLGHATSTKHDSQDVTDEFYDLEARLKNKRVEEERLLDHLKKSTGKLDEILAVERELSRVRGEIENAQGRLQKLTKLSELTTIIVSMQEQKDYVPPSAPTYTTSVGRTFGGSIDAMVALFKAIGLVVVAIVPWLPFPLIFVGAIVWLTRRSRRKPVSQP